MGNETLELGFDLEALINKGKRRPKVKYESLKEGTQGFRILPPFNPARRDLNYTYHVHWVQGASGLIKVMCTYYTEKYCPLCEQHKSVTETLERLKKENPKSEQISMLQEAEQKLRKSRTVYYNAVNSNQEVVVLQLSSTVSQLLDKKIIEAAQKKQFDATSLKAGVWFEFTKSGKGRDSVTVDFRRISKEVNGELVEVLDRTPIKVEVVENIETLVTEIHKPEALWIKTFTARQLADYLRGVLLEEANGNKANEADSSDEAPSAPPPSGMSDAQAEATRLRSLAGNKS